MVRHQDQIAAALLFLLILEPATAKSQDVIAVPVVAASADNMLASGATIDDAQNIPILAPEQLDQILAPIALYPDPLVEQILMAATYPLQVVELERWLQNPGNAALKDDQLATALAQQPWDPSVKSLALFPQTVQLMDANLRWTAQLGDSFIAQQDDVMDSVQRLRQRARAAGTLTSTPQQNVATQDQDILIQPSNPDVVYVPYYNATTVYGSWPYPDYPPVYFAPSPTYIVSPTVISFGAAIIVIESLRGWHHWDWRHHRMVLDDRHYIALNQGKPSRTPGVWQHDPGQRRGVPHADTRDHVTEPRKPAEVRHLQYERNQPFPVGAHDERLSEREKPRTPPINRRDTIPVPSPMPQPRPRPVIDPSLLRMVPLQSRPEGAYEGRHVRDSERARPDSMQPGWQHRNVQIERAAPLPQPVGQPRHENTAPGFEGHHTQPGHGAEQHAPALPADVELPVKYHNDRRDQK